MKLGLGLTTLAVLLPIEGEAPAPPDYGTTIGAVVERFESGAWDACLAEASAWLEVSSAAPEWQRAQVQYARGLALLHRALEAGPASLAPVGADEPVHGVDWFDAASAFGSARALAGPGVLRRHAMYDLGVAHLMRAETWFATIPEVAQAAGAPPPPGMPGMTGAPGAHGGPQGPDPLQEARDAYGEAKERLVERLREDWRDEDTRANLEWIQRRLRELDAIEQQREEQQQEQDSQDPNQDQDSESGEEGDEQDPNESESSDDDQEGSSGEDPQESQRPDPTEGDESEQEQEPGEPQEPEEAESAPRPEEGEGEATSSEEAPAERHLTKEEVMRLLDRLEELEEQGQALEAALRQARQIPVERDW